jgi:hypothetical protein
MKRCLLFAGFDYYPSGGWNDFVESFDSFEQAVQVGKGLSPSLRCVYDWYHVIDRDGQFEWVAKG